MRRLAEASGGACEFATPGEDLRAAIGRMFARIRQQACTRLRLQWRLDRSADESDDEHIRAPQWTSPVPMSVFGGDTVHVFAGFVDSAPTHVRLFTEEGPNGEREVASARIEPRLEAGDSLPRMAAAARLGACTDAEALALALRYQLVTEHTHCLVVHERADADKAGEFAQLHQVPQMLAAGFGGVGRLGGDPFASLSCASGNELYGAAQMNVPDDYFDRYDPNLLRSAAGRSEMLGSMLPVPATTESLRAVLDLALEALEAMDAREAESLARTLAAAADAALFECIGGLFALGLARPAAWALWVHWMLERTGADASRKACSAITALTANVTEAQRQGAEQSFEDLWNARRPIGADRVARRLRSRSSQL